MSTSAIYDKTGGHHIEQKLSSKILRDLWKI